MVATEAEIRSWVETELGGSLARWQPLAAGNSRTTWLADLMRGDDIVPLVVRAEGGDGPFSGTELTLAREAVVYRALSDSAVALPRLYDADQQRNVVVMSRLAGSADWSDAALPSYLEALARLHTLDPARLDLPGYRPTARGDVELWADIAQQRLAPPSPFVSLALEILRHAFPGEPTRLSLCHGDAGPGNFLEQDDTVTGLLDWEFAHLGDPIDDLAWITVRAVLFGIDLADFGACVCAHYAPLAATPLAENRLRYWQAVVVLRNLVTCLASIANPVRGRDRLVHYMLVPGLNRLLVTSLARLIGVDLPREEAPAIPAPVPGGAALEEIGLSLTDLIGTLEGDLDRARVKRMRYLLTQLAHTMGAAGDIARADARDHAVQGTLEERLLALARIADREVALFPRAARIAYADLVGFDN